MPNKSDIGCPNQGELQSLLNETLVDETISDHISTCTICQAELDLLTQPAELSDYQRAVAVHSDATRHLGPPICEGDIGSLNELAIERQIGAGGMGVVYQGRDDRLGRKVAVKLLSRCLTLESDARFTRESKAAAKLQHNNIVSVYTSGRTQDGIPYLVMPLVQGPTLKETILTEVPGIRESTEWIRQIALGLAAAHELDIVHRDVKPGNILLDQSDDSAKLTDFGLARSETDATLTRANVIAGTPEYMSPEQIENPQSRDKRTDIYALGITLYECLTGTTPFRGQPILILEQHLHANPIRPGNINSQVPRDLETICLKAIDKDPNRRYQTAQQFADDLARQLNGQPILARETTGFEKLIMLCRRKPGLAALALTSLGLVLALGIGSSVAAWKLKLANDNVLQEKQNALLAEKHAVNDRRAAVDSLAMLVDSLYDELSNNAATIKTREQVVTAAIDGLQAITHVNGDSHADRTSFRAYLRIADLMSLRGSNLEAESNYKAAIEIGRDLLARETDGLFSKRELAMAISRLGTHYMQSGDQRAIESNQEAIHLLNEILADNPGDMDALARLAIQFGYELNNIRQAEPQNFAKVIETGNTFLASIKRLLVESNDNPMACEAVHTIYFCLGRAHLESNDPIAADFHFELAREYLDRSLSAGRANVKLRAASAVLNRAHAMVLGSLGRLDESVIEFEAALKEMKELSSLNPEDKVEKRSVANTATLMSAAENALGRYEPAIELLDEAIGIYSDILVLDPANEQTKTLILNARFTKLVSQLQMDRWDDARQSTHQIQSDLEDFGISPVAANMKKFYLAVASPLDEALSRLAGQFSGTSTATGDCVAVMLVAEKDARTATTDEISLLSRTLISRLNPNYDWRTFDELFIDLHRFENVFDFFAVQRKRSEARVFGMIARNLADSKSPDAMNIRTQFLQRSIQALREIANEPPGPIREVILNDPGLIWVRGTSEFATFWEGVVKQDLSE